MGSQDVQPVLLVIEDEPASIRLIEEALSDVGVPVDLVVATDGVEAFDVFKQRGEYAGVPLPDLVLLDLGLPNKTGKQVLREMQADDELRPLPVIVLSNSDDPDDIHDSYRNGASAYVSKPNDYDEMVGIVRRIDEFWFSVASLPPSKAGE